MKDPTKRLSLGTRYGLFVAAAVLAAACQDGGTTGTDDAGMNPGPDGGSAADLSVGGGSDMAVSGPPENNPMLNGITSEHNKKRAAVNPVPAMPLPELTWSANLAASAQAWADRCMFMHSTGSGYGENIYASSGSSTPVQVVTSWDNEKANYNYSANTCSRTCGHYTQVVWRSSLRLGCAMKNCTINSPFGGGSWQFWVCNYDPAGNLNNTRPY